MSAKTAGGVNHSLDWTSRACALSCQHLFVLAGDVASGAQVLRVPRAKVGARQPIACAGAHDRSREISVWTVSERDRAVDRILAVDVVAQRAGIFKCHDAGILA